MPKVEETAVCWETDVDAVWQLLFCLTEHDAEEDGEQCGGQNASLLDAVGDGEAARQRLIVLHLTFANFYGAGRFWCSKKWLKRSAEETACTGGEKPSDMAAGGLRPRQLALISEKGQM